MRENGHEQGIVVPVPCLHMKAEIESIHSSDCHAGGANVSTKCTLSVLASEIFTHSKGRGLEIL